MSFPDAIVAKLTAPGPLVAPSIFRHTCAPTRSLISHA